MQVHTRCTGFVTEKIYVFIEIKYIIQILPLHPSKHPKKALIVHRDMPLATSEWHQTFLQSSDDIKDHQCSQIKKRRARQDMRSPGLLGNLLPSCKEQDIQQLETKTIRFGLECKLCTYAPPQNNIWTSLVGNRRLRKVKIEFIKCVNRCRKGFC